jgi:hypothetical protein
MIDHQPPPGADFDGTERVDEPILHEENAAEAPWNPHVYELSQTIGPRPPGSQAESDAADYLVSALDAAGLPAARLTSRSPRYTEFSDLAFAGATVLAILVTVLLPPLGVVLILVTLGLMLADIFGYVDLHQWLPHTNSVNVLSIIPAVQADTRRLVVTATLDTGKVGFLSRWHLASGYAWMHALILASLVIALLLGIIVLVDNGNALRPVLVIPALMAIAALALAAEREFGKKSSPGAITNASGVAALVDIASHINENPPQWLEVWILGVGASSVRRGGMATFLERNRFDPDTTYFVHLQSPGGGAPVVPVTTGAGLRTAPATPLLTWIFDSVRSDPGNLTPASVRRLPLQTLANATHRAGYQSVVVAGVDDSGTVPFFDDPEDLPFQVRDDGIAETVDLVSAAIDGLDREVAARAMLARSSASVQDTSERPAVSRDLPSGSE